nr:MAG TPA: hypothetical protein [Caudoviricetes sp.]
MSKIVNGGIPRNGIEPLTCQGKQPDLFVAM